MKVKSEKSPAKLQNFRKSIAAVITKPIVTLLAKTGVTPNMVTWFGFIIILGAAVLAGMGHPFAAGWVMLASGFFDIIDGALARGTNQVTRFGAVLDSTLDRVSEAVILLGIAAFYLFNPVAHFEWIVLLIGVAMLGSFLVSYVPRPGGGDRPGMSGWDIYKNRESHYTGFGSFIERNQSGADHCSGDSSGDESGDRNTEDVVRGIQNQTD